MQLDTHLNINTSLCGRVIKLQENYAEVLLHTTQQMIADKQGLVHGGFIFGAADYAAMSAVNDPLVVLGSSNSKFIAPAKVGDVVLCKATIISEKSSRSTSFCLWKACVWRKFYYFCFRQSCIIVVLIDITFLFYYNIWKHIWKVYFESDKYIGYSKKFT